MGLIGGSGLHGPLVNTPLMRGAWTRRIIPILLLLLLIRNIKLLSIINVRGKKIDT